MDSNFALKRLDFLRFWDPAQNLGKSSRFCRKYESMTPTFFLILHQGTNRRLHTKYKKFCAVRPFGKKKVSQRWRFLGIFRKKNPFLCKIGVHDPHFLFLILHQGTNRTLHAKNKKNCAVSFAIAMYARAQEQLCVPQKYHNTLNHFSHHSPQLKNVTAAKSYRFYSRKLPNTQVWPFFGIFPPFLAQKYFA